MRACVHAGGIRQQFKAAQPLVEKILRALKAKEGLAGPLGAAIWDQGDAVGAWTGETMSCVLFPTGELRAVAIAAAAAHLNVRFPCRCI